MLELINATARAYAFPDLALTLNRIAVGAFFVTSGYHKLFNRKRHTTFIGTLQDCGVRDINVMQWFVPSVEFLGGISVTVGFLSRLAAFPMLVILAVAILTDGLKRMRRLHPIDPADRLCDVLYMPETLMGVMLIVVALAGPGAFAVTAL